MIRKLLMTGLAVSLLVTAPMSASADDRPPRPRGVVTLPDAVQQRNQAPAQRVQFSMEVVHATEAHNRVDPRLGNIPRYLSNLRYTGYELLNSYTRPLNMSRSETFQIQGGREVIITLLSRDERRCKMRIQINAGRGHKLLDTTLYINRNATFFFAGPKYKDGILVLPLTARY